VRSERLGAGMDLLQHDRVGFFVRHEDLEHQRSGLGCQTTLAMSLQMLQVIPAPTTTLLLIGFILKDGPTPSPFRRSSSGYPATTNHVSGVRDNREVNV
jgi:hypothetical protein